MNRVTVIGGGPSGLYFALLAKARFPRSAIEVYEQSPADATYGFGIVLAERAMDRLRKADAASHDAILSASFVSRHRVIRHPDEQVFIEGGGIGAAIARLKLLQILTQFCTAQGVSITYGARIEDLAHFAGSDLIVGADGVSSMTRSTLARELGTTSWDLTNRVAWYGTTRHFPYPLLSFKRTAAGHFVAAAYAYTENSSTFVAECDAATWIKSGLDRMSEDERRLVAEQIFADELRGCPLISNKSAWRCLPVVRNEHWSRGNVVIIGDALHSAHPSIGSGTRIAMEDSIALVQALEQMKDQRLDVRAALRLFRQQREPIKQKLVQAAEKSFMWYEEFGRKVDALAPVDFVWDFLMRTGRIEDARLMSEYPAFVTKYAHRLINRTAGPWNRAQSRS